MNLWLAIVLIVAFCVIGFVLGMTYRKKVAEREISSAEDEAKRIINDAIKSAESKKREALVEAKEEIHKSRSEFEREEKARRADLQKQERRLQQKEENLDRKTDSLERKNETLARKIADVEAQQQEIALIKKSQLEMLEKVSGYTVDEAKAYLINALKDEVTHEMAVKVKEIEAQYKDEAEERAREIIVTAIQRCAADHASEVTVSVVPLPNDEMKGRIMAAKAATSAASKLSRAAILLSTIRPRLSPFQALTPSAARWRVLRLKSSLPTAESIRHALRKWSPRRRRKSTRLSRPKASARCSKRTSTA